ncbi:hypothetical protein DXA95_06265 [Odoribacter sp. OF09-27XD]|nr:hypothetical protein DXA95_06265 [Odoribacter sp. OF09-27XD]
MVRQHFNNFFIPAAGCGVPGVFPWVFRLSIWIPPFFRKACTISFCAFLHAQENSVHILQLK